jgi:hypothetical protein
MPLQSVNSSPMLGVVDVTWIESESFIVAFPVSLYPSAIETCGS